MGTKIGKKVVIVGRVVEVEVRRMLKKKVGKVEVAVNVVKSCKRWKSYACWLRRDS